MKRSLLALILALSALAFSGCATLSRLMPGGAVTLADALWSGASGAPVSVVGSIASSVNPDPRVSAVLAVLQGVGVQDPFGVLLPITPAGETSPRWVVCAGKWGPICSAIPINSHVDFAGSPVGPGLLWTPHRLKASS